MPVKLDDGGSTALSLQLGISLVSSLSFLAKFEDINVVFQERAVAGALIYL